MVLNISINYFPSNVAIAGFCSFSNVLLFVSQSSLPFHQHIEITSWLVSAYDFYSRVVKDR